MVAFTAKAILLLLPLTSPVPSSQFDDKNTKGHKDEPKGMQESTEWWNVKKSWQVKSRLGNEQSANEEQKIHGEHWLLAEVRQLKKQLSKTQHEQVFFHFIFMKEKKKNTHIFQ